MCAFLKISAENQNGRFCTLTHTSALTNTNREWWWVYKNGHSIFVECRESETQKLVWHFFYYMECPSSKSMSQKTAKNVINWITEFSETAFQESQEFRESHAIYRFPNFLIFYTTHFMRGRERGWLYSWCENFMIAACTSSCVD